MLECLFFQGLQDYESLVRAMEQRVAGIKSGDNAQALWFLEHEDVYTAGVRCDDVPQHLKVVRSPRGGQLTYHGPGQRVIYLMLSLARQDLTVTTFVQRLEQWIIDALARFRVSAFVLQGYPGVFTQAGKIASLGVRVSSGITSHGVALNVCTTLSRFDKIVPCGNPHHTMTSLHDMGCFVSIEDVDEALLATCPFGLIKGGHKVSIA